MSDNPGPSEQPRRLDWYTIADFSGSAQADLRNPKDVRLLTQDTTDCVAC